MSIQTDFSVAPYFDDYTDHKDFYKILFRPGVSVQARELNQLQTILQKQIERFGNNIFKQGTIVDGCDITFHDKLKYVKLRDVQTNSQPVDVELFRTYRIRNQNDITPLEAVIIDVAPGFESTSPDLNTLFIRYINTGFETGGPVDGQQTFVAGEVLTVYDPSAPVERVTINNGSSGFISTDRVVLTSAIAVQNTSGGTEFVNGFNVGDEITDGTATVRIIEIIPNIVPDAVVFRIAPLTSDLVVGDFSKWTLTTQSNIQRIQEGNESSIGVVTQILGTGAVAALTTSVLGEITEINILQKGSGYIVPPHVAVTSQSANFGQINIFNATASTTLANVTVAGAEFAPVGNSYAMTVGEGVIYQKGYFSRVSEQLVIVDKYTNVPDGKSVGFETVEEVIDSNEDRSLLDNATGAPNFAAPGANRLKLSPRLKVISKAEADELDDWLYVVEFANGNPYKQNRQTVYNVIGKEIDRRFNETVGNFVTNPFLLNTKNSLTFAEEAETFNVVIDPGTAFINGTRVETTSNFETTINKGITTRQVVNGNISVNYGNYVRVNQVGGHFQFNTGDRVVLYDTPAEYITNSFGSSPTPSGNIIGYARIRSIVYDSGIVGTAGGVFRLYLFDIEMNAGQNFSNVRSIYYDGPIKGIADTVVENGRTVIRDNTSSTLLFYAGSPAVNNATNISYVFRTSESTTIGSDGTITLSVPSAGTQQFPYTGMLSSTQLRDIIVVPTQSATGATPLAGTVSVSSGSQTITGVGTSFVSDYRVGDFIQLLATQTSLQIASIESNTEMTATEASAATVSSSQHRIFFPAYTPIPINRDGRSAITSGDQTQITINLGTPLIIPADVIVTYNVRESNVSPVAKVVNRDRFVRLRLSDNVYGQGGPWALGVGDIFRLKKVYRGTNQTFGPSEGEDITQHFYVDHNQNEDYYGISYLYLRPQANISLTSNDFLLVQFDYFTVAAGTEGLKGPGGSGTYPINDTVTLANADTTINTVEIPEVFGARGTYYDLRDHFDFRPSANNTVTPSADFASAPINPVDQLPANRLSSADKKFPAPDSQITTSITYYEGRVDRVIINDSNQFRILAGTPGTNEPPRSPDNALSINIVRIPPYPSLPYILSQEMIDYIDTKIANEKFSTRRVNEYRVTTAVTDSERASLQPRGYTMKDIGSLEQRISNLEYYTSLTMTEVLAQKRTLIGADGLDRFKFGFFVDGFEDYTFSEVTNPGYNASIVDGYLSPKIVELCLQLVPADQTDGILPYVEQSFVSQTRATEPAPPSTNPSTIVVPTRTQSIVSVVQEQRNRSSSDSGSVFEEFFYTFSETAGPVELYVNSRDNNVAAEISQANSPNGPWTSVVSSRTAQAITLFDVQTKKLSLNGGRRIEHLGTLERKTSPNSPAFGNWLEDQFKLLFTHNPSNGIFYRIRIYKGGRAGGLFGSGRRGTFGYKLFYPVDTDINSTRILPTTNFNLAYSGLVLSGSDGFNDQSITDLLTQ